MKELPITIGNGPDKPQQIVCGTFPHTIQFLFQKVTDFGRSLTRVVISPSLKPIAWVSSGHGPDGRVVSGRRLPVISCR